MIESKRNNNKAIGIFDSGIGGLTVFKEIRKHLPNEKIVYLGDTARVPYGIRSTRTILKYSIANADFLVKQDIKFLIIACNTASAVATEQLRLKYSIPILDVIAPGARKAVRISKNRRIGIIGTEGTIRSQAYQNEIKRLDPDIVTLAQPCPLFVPLAEEGWVSIQDKVVCSICERYLHNLMTSDIDTLVLGCTHYPLLRDIISTVMGDNVTLVDSAEETALEAMNLLLENKALNDSESCQENKFYLTDIPHHFVETGKLFLGEELTNVKLIDI